MLLSIIITNYKNPELLKVCIDSIRKNISFSDYEVIVSDSETEEDMETMMREDYPNISFLPAEKNIGFGATVERGYALSRGEYILILNGDIIIKKDSIEKLLEYGKNTPSAGIIGPKLLSFNESLQESCFRFYTPMTIVYRRTFLGKFSFAKRHMESFLMKDFDKKTAREVDWLQGSAMLTRRSAVEKVGLMDPRFKMYFEDVDWCRRFWEAGLGVVYFPDSEMYHYHGRHSARTKKSWLLSLIFNRWTWMHIISAIKYFWKYQGKPLPNHA